VAWSDGRIVAAGPLAQLDRALEKSAETVLDATGKTVLPGLVNAHEHLDDRRTFGSFQERTTRPREILLLGAARSTLASLSEGFTTVRDCGGMGDNPLFVRQAIELGLFVGPRVRTCIAPICQSGGYARPLSIPADGPDEVRKRARELLGRGADFIKCMASTGAAGAREGGPLAMQMSVPELAAAFDEAHRAGKRTTVHAHPPAAINAAIDAGVDAIEHGVLIDEPTAQRMATNRIFLVSTMSEILVSATEGLRYRRPRLQVERAKPLVDVAIAGMRRAIEAGVKVAVGLDVMGRGVHELQLLVQAGMTPMQALQAATRVGAELLGMEREIGSVEPDKFADLLIVDGDPLVDMCALGCIDTVVVGGRVLSGSAIRSLVGPQLPGYLVDHGRLLSPEEYV
jgi:imidazolonepropionase-like amidohydrolase